jgi:hypothetical protein
MIDCFPLVGLPEISLWIQVITSATLLVLTLPSYQADASELIKALTLKEKS